MDDSTRVVLALIDCVITSSLKGREEVCSPLIEAVWDDSKGVLLEATGREEEMFLPLERIDVSDPLTEADKEGPEIVALGPIDGLMASPLEMIDVWNPLRDADREGSDIVVLAALGAEEAITAPLGIIDDSN